MPPHVPYNCWVPGWTDAPQRHRGWHVPPRRSRHRAPGPGRVSAGADTAQQGRRVSQGSQLVSPPGCLCPASPQVPSCCSSPQATHHHPRRSSHPPPLPTSPSPWQVGVPLGLEPPAPKRMPFPQELSRIPLVGRLAVPARTSPFPGRRSWPSTAASHGSGTGRGRCFPAARSLFLARERLTEGSSSQPVPRGISPRHGKERWPQGRSKSQSRARSMGS